MLYMPNTAGPRCPATSTHFLMAALAFFKFEKQWQQWSFLVMLTVTICFFRLGNEMWLCHAEMWCNVIMYCTVDTVFRCSFSQ